MPQFIAQDVSNVLWALATLDATGHDSFIARALERAATILHTYKSLDFGNVAWALGRLNHMPQPAFLQQLVDNAGPKLDTFGIQVSVSQIVAMYPGIALMTWLNRPQLWAQALMRNSLLCLF